MSDLPENLMLVFLRRLDGRMDELQADMRDIKHRLTSVAIQLGQLNATVSSQYAGMAVRLDRIEGRLERLERHSDILPA